MYIIHKTFSFMQSMTVGSLNWVGMYVGKTVLPGPDSVTLNQLLLLARAFHCRDFSKTFSQDEFDTPSFSE